MTLEEYDDLPEEEQEEIREEGRESRKTVFSREYDSGGPGGGGYDWVVMHRDLFFVFTMDDLPPGPFSSLPEAIAEGYLTDVTSATTEIVCVGLSVKKLLPLLEVQDSPVRLPINGEGWAFDDKNGWSRAGKG
jgi:hypothetical protein